LIYRFLIIQNRKIAFICQNKFNYRNSARYIEKAPQEMSANNSSHFHEDITVAALFRKTCKYQGIENRDDLNSRVKAHLSAYFIACGGNCWRREDVYSWNKRNWFLGGVPREFIPNPQLLINGRKV